MDYMYIGGVSKVLYGALPGRELCYFSPSVVGVFMPVDLLIAIVNINIFFNSFIIQENGACGLLFDCVEYE
jgi:hypothetical protein